MIPASLRALVARSIDYAGLFPPASLSLQPALENYATYVQSEDEWMLGSFVLPVGKFDDAVASLGRFNVEHRLRISALGPKTDTPEEFIAALRDLAQTVGEFDARYGASASTTQIEMALPTNPGATLSDATDALGALDVPVFWEAPADESERLVAFLAAHEPAQTTSRFGFKLRTGGVIASAFPSSIQIARALVATVSHGVAIKFTAGLHHPVRVFHPSVQTKMHGFLNVLGAGVLAAEHGWDVSQTSKMLDDEAPFSFGFDEDFFTWREWRVATHRVREHRKLVTSFGSCSFVEPREDLCALNLLPPR